MFGYGIDPLYIALAVPGLLLALYASFKTKSTFRKYSEVKSYNGLTGAQAAARLMKNAGIYDVEIEEVQGFLSDHYNPMSKKLALSPDVYNSTSLSAIGVACHEAGHAIQHKVGYQWMHVRTVIAPATNVFSWLSYIIIFLGFILSSLNMVFLGAILFSGVVLFSLVTLPVEWDASKRAKDLMVQAGIVQGDEMVAAGKVLNAAFLTYVAAAVSSLLTLLYYLIRAGVLGGRSDD